LARQASLLGLRDLEERLRQPWPSFVSPGRCESNSRRTGSLVDHDGTAAQAGCIG
jgi:hypothetical protein